MHAHTIAHLEKSNPRLATQFTAAVEHLGKNPEDALTRSRKVLEQLLKEMPEASGSTIAERITSLNSHVPEWVPTYMHFIRKIANSYGTHDNDEALPITKQAADVVGKTADILAWYYKIPVELVAPVVPAASSPPSAPPTIQQQMQELANAQLPPVAPLISSESSRAKLMAKFFIADPVYQTWSKIAVWTSDGRLYCEYLNHMRLAVIDKTVSAEALPRFRFGEEIGKSGYQPMREVSKETATAYQLTRQENWVKRYLASRGLD